MITISIVAKLIKSQYNQTTQYNTMEKTSIIKYSTQSKELRHHQI